MPGLPRALDAILTKALAPLPADRYPDARSLAKDLERWLADEPVTAWREPFLARARRWIKRHRTLVTTSLAVLFVGLVGSIALAVQQRRANDDLRTNNRLLDLANHQVTTANFDLSKVNLDLVDANGREQQAKNEAIAQRDQSEENRRLARKILYPSLMNIVSHSFNDQKYERAASLLREAMPQPGDMIDHRRFEWYYAWNALEKNRRTMQIAAGPSHLRICADGKILAAHCGSNVLVYLVPEGKLIQTFPANRFNAKFDLSIDGHYLIFQEMHSVKGNRVPFIEVWEISPDGKPTQKPVREFQAFDRWIDVLTFSPDGEWIAAGGDGGRIRIWEARTGELKYDIEKFVIPKQETDTFRALSISPDRRWLACEIRTRAILMNLETANTPALDVPPGDYHRVAITQANSFCVWTDQNVLWSWSLADFAKGFTEKNARKIKLAEGINSVDEFPQVGEGPTTYIRGADRVHGFRAPIGRDTFIFIGEPEPKMMTPVPFTIPVLRDVSSFAIRPDGRELVFATRSGLVTFHDRAAAAEPELLLRHPNHRGIHGLEFMPDGRLLSLSQEESLMRARPGEAPDWFRPAPIRTEFLEFSTPSMALSRDGKWFAARFKDKIAVLDAETGEDICSIVLKQKDMFQARSPLAFVPGHEFLLFAIDRGDKMNLPFEPKPSQLGIWDFGALRASTRAAGAAGGGLADYAALPLFFPKSVREITSPTHLLDIDVSPDGRWFAAVGRDGVSRVWRRAPFSAVPTKQWKLNDILRCVRFSPDGQTIVVGTVGGNVWYCSMTDASEPQRIPAHRSAVNHILFEHDGKTVITGGEDGQVKFLIRDLPQERFTINTGAKVEGLALSADGTMLAVGDNAGYVRLYRAATPNAVLAMIRARWKEDPESRERTRDLLLGLWSALLEKGDHGLISEAEEAVKKLNVKERGEFATWLKAFAEFEGKR